MSALRTQRATAIGVLAASVVVAAGALMVAAGANPLTGLQGFVSGVSSSPYRVGEVLVGATPLALIALTLVPALRAGVFSVGAEGQLIIGAVLATAATLGLDSLSGGSLPPLILWLAGAVAGAIGGAAWAMIPAIFAACWRANEILSTLLMNYLAVGVLGLSLRTWLASGENTATPQSRALPEAALLPELIPSTRAHWGAALVVVAAVGLWWWQRSAPSVRLHVFASRPALAQRLGATRPRTIYVTMLISGIGAGVVGWIQVAGIGGRLLSSVSGGVGFAGVAVALLGALVPAGVVVAAIFFAALAVGAMGVQSATGTVPTSIAEVLKGLLMLGAACLQGLRWGPKGDG